MPGIGGLRDIRFWGIIRVSRSSRTYDCYRAWPLGMGRTRTYTTSFSPSGNRWEAIASHGFLSFFWSYDPQETTPDFVLCWAVSGDKQAMLPRPAEAGSAVVSGGCGPGVLPNTHPGTGQFSLIWRGLVPGAYHCGVHRGRPLRLLHGFGETTTRADSRQCSVSGQVGCGSQGPGTGALQPELWAPLHPKSFLPCLFLTPGISHWKSPGAR